MRVWRANPHYVREMYGSTVTVSAVSISLVVTMTVFARALFMRSMVTSTDSQESYVIAMMDDLEGLVAFTYNLKPVMSLQHDIVILSPL